MPGLNPILTLAVLSSIVLTLWYLNRGVGVLVPSRVFLGYWLAFLGGAVLLFPGGRLTPMGVLVVGVGASIFSLGAWTASIGERTSRGYMSVRSGVSEGRTSEPRWRAGPIRNVVSIGVLSNIAAAAVALRVNGFTFANLLSFAGMFDVANTTSVARYTQVDYGSPLISGLLGLGYAASLVGPFSRLSCLSWKRFSIAPLASSVLYAVVTTERLGMLISLALSMGSFLVVSVVRTGAAPRLNWRGFVKVSLVLVIVGMLFSAIAFLRAGSLESRVVEAVWQKQAVYAFGSLSALSAWVEEPHVELGITTYGYGTASIAGVEYLTGMSRASTRAYGEFMVVDAEGHRSNVYTIFRALALDFGFAGGCIVLWLLGFLAGRLYRRLRSSGSPLAAAVLSCIYGVIALSNTMPITTFTNVLVGMGLGGVALWSSGRTGSSSAPASASGGHDSARNGRPVRTRRTPT